MTYAVPTLFIPALLCDDAMYRAVIDLLGDAIAAQVLLSPRPALADSVAEILAQAPPRFALVGTSYGGSLALAIALAAPERVMALWLMGCSAAAPNPGTPDLAAALDADPQRVIERLSRLAVSPQSPGAAQTYRAMAQRVGAAAGAAQARAAASRADMVARLGLLTMPALVLWGKQDALSPLSFGEALAFGLPNARLAVLEGCGHLPTLERPTEAAALFRSLLEALPPPQA